MSKLIKFDDEELEMLEAYEAGKTTPVVNKIADLLAIPLEAGDECIEFNFPQSNDLTKSADF